MGWFQTLSASVSNYSGVSPLSIGVWGDSLANGTNEIYTQPDTDDSIQGSANADTLFEWDGSQLVDLVGGDTIGANNGSPYPAMANRVKEVTNRPMHIIESANGGAEFALNGDTNNYSATDGVLRSQFVTKKDSYLSFRNKPDLNIVFGNCGVNDIRGNAALADIETEINDMVAFLLSEFPTALIVINQIGRNDGSSSRNTAIRGYIDNAISNNERVKLGIDLSLYPESYYFDGLHLYQSAQEIYGVDLANRFLSLLNITP